MAKGIGLIGNFKGKVGNMVGYKLTDSNSGNTQGIRVYQPIVKNPKTAAQAEQRAKLAPINATYRALKMVIDRGNEGLPYGNKSRLAWLKQAFKPQHMPWFEKGDIVSYPVGCVLTKGSLVGVVGKSGGDGFELTIPGVSSESTIATYGALSTALKNGYPALKDGDQITMVCVSCGDGVVHANVRSFIIDPTSTDALSDISLESEKVVFEDMPGDAAGCAIVSREGANGEHLRSTTVLNISNVALNSDPYKDPAKTAAIESYMSSAAVNADWAEESIQ